MAAPKSKPYQAALQTLMGWKIGLRGGFVVWRPTQPGHFQRQVPSARLQEANNTVAGEHRLGSACSVVCGRTLGSGYPGGLDGPFSPSGAGLRHPKSTANPESPGNLEKPHRTQRPQGLVSAPFREMVVGRRSWGPGKTLDIGCVTRGECRDAIDWIPAGSRQGRPLPRR